MKDNFVKIKEIDGISLYVNTPQIGVCACGEGGHFEDINTGENLGRECRDYIRYYDNEGNKLDVPVENNVRWVRDD